MGLIKRTKNMAGLNVYWGDFHKHLVDIDRADAIIEDAKKNLDFYAVLCYPFTHEKKNSLTIESVRQRPEFLEMWKSLQKAARNHNEPGQFVTFLGYEWHGNRTRWGDHNVIYFDENNPLNDAWELEDLYANLRSRKAIVIPHHTAYFKGWRGKDWSVLDENLSPVMEIYSIHGSSESIDSPVGMLINQSMGPRTSGGTWVDALNAGCRIGAIGSNDGPSPLQKSTYALPGMWNWGVAGVWAEELTRESIWEALKARRTYGVTGDRIKVMFTINGEIMGSVISCQEPPEAKVEITCAQPLDRIELIYNGIVAETYCHRGKWERKDRKQGFYKILFECGWGPFREDGFKDLLMKWQGNLRLENGKIKSIQPRFTALGQSFELQDQKRCSFRFNTTRDNPMEAVQGLIVEIEGDLNTRMDFNIDGHSLDIPLRDIADKTILVPLLGESEERVYKTFKVRKEELENPDLFFHNARKIRIGSAYPENSYRTEISFKNLPVEKGNNYYYIRASQIDGQMAWSSPIWLEN